MKLNEASMGPALFTRENGAREKRAHAHDSIASMGPALFTRENLGVSPAMSLTVVSLQWGPRCSRGKTDGSSVTLTNLVALQWGPRCSRGKTISIAGRRVKERSFNGARVVHAGKHVTQRLGHWRLKHASMGPALFTRENSSSQTQDESDEIWLQGGPRCSRGKTC